MNSLKQNIDSQTLIFIVIKNNNDKLSSNDLINYFNDKGKNLITYEKPKTNPHWHIILDTTIPINNLRNHMTRNLCKGNKKTVAKCRDNFNSLVYILKEKNIVNNTILTQEELDYAIHETDKITKKIHEDKVSKKNNSFKYRYITNYTPLEWKEVKTFEDQNELFAQNIFDQDDNRIQIYDHIEDYTSEQFRINYELIDKYIYRRFLNSLIMHYYPKLHKIRKEDWFYRK